MEQEVWARFTRDPRDPRNAHLRASDGDRDVARDVLTEAYGDGRLDRDELDARSSAVAAARTLGELPALLGDLVPTWTTPPGGPGRALMSPTQLDEQAVTLWRHQRQAAVWRFVVVSLVCWAVWAVVMPGDFAWPVFAMLGTGVPALRAVTSRAEIVAHERRRLERRQRRTRPPGWGDR